MSDELVEFVRARLDEDEQLARECEAEVGPERAGERFTDDSGDADRDSFPSYPWGSQEAELAYMAGPGHPSRVLAEVEAKRRLVERLAAVKDDGVSYPYEARSLAEDVLLELASVYPVAAAPEH